MRKLVIQPVPFVHFTIIKNQNLTYMTCHILDQIAGLLHVVGISSMAFPRKKNMYKKIRGS